MSMPELNAALYQKAVLPVSGFARRFKPELSEDGSPSIPPEMRRESRRNIREFITLMSKMHDGFQEPIVDVACGYRTNFSEATSFSRSEKVAYIAFDHHVNDNVDPYPPDFVASAYAIPLPDASVGTVICTELLEHLEHPNVAVAEMARVLKKNGTILVTVPGKDVPKHEKPPFQYDYRRFSPEDLQILLEQNGIGGIDTTRRWFEEEGVIKEINLLAVGNKQTEGNLLRRTQLLDDQQQEHVLVN